MKTKYLIVGAILLLFTLALAACSSPPAPTEAPVLPTAVPCPTAAPCPSCPTCPTPVVKDVPNQDAWANSPHNDATAQAFTHWDTADPKEVPTDCARCHSTPGYQDYLGADGSQAGVVDKAAPIGTTITCVACHNSATATLTSVTFPSGVEIKDLGPEARCMVCHQGRASKVQVDDALKTAGVTDDLDKVSSDLGFTNIHYFAAAATLYGSQTQGGYEYPGKSYDIKNAHVAGYNTCVGCHDPHTLQVKVDSCATCHTNVKTVDDLKNIRMNGSLVDYNGNGDITEGIYYEIKGLQDMLLQAIQAYAKEITQSPVIYDENTYPYFFIDTNGNGTAEPDEIQSANGYKSWTGRLLEAAYNYQMSIKDPGDFAHNPKYIIELLYDSIDDLNTKLSTPVDLSKANRIDVGHFAGSEEPFRHWDTADNSPVPATCVKCHTATGLPFLLQNGVTIAMPPTNGLSCTTCHDNLTTFTRYQVKQVTFPSGATLSLDNTDANLCINCHQGRESTVSVNTAIKKANVGPDEVSDALGFINSHYFGAGATLLGTNAKGAYEYDGKQYNGQFMHVDAFNTCVECHDVHKLTVNTDKCAACHGSSDPSTFRNPAGDSTDYDGDGNTTEGIAGEVKTMQDKLLAAMQDYTTRHNLDPIVYSGASYPYYFKDTNGDGQLSADEATSDNAYKTWTPNLLRAAYNYQWVTKDPGSFAHNGKYIMQILFDSIEGVGGNTAGMTRPPVVTPPAQ
jgi:Cytochrome c7 and related cytochrome c